MEWPKGAARTRIKTRIRIRPRTRCQVKVAINTNSDPIVDFEWAGVDCQGSGRQAGKINEITLKKS